MTYWWCRPEKHSDRVQPPKVWCGSQDIDVISAREFYGSRYRMQSEWFRWKTRIDFGCCSLSSWKFCGMSFFENGIHFLLQYKRKAIFDKVLLQVLGKSWMKWATSSSISHLVGSGIISVSYTTFSLLKDAFLNVLRLHYNSIFHYCHILKKSYECSTQRSSGMESTARRWTLINDHIYME